MARKEQRVTQVDEPANSSDLMDVQTAAKHRFLQERPDCDQTVLLSPEEKR